MRYVLIAFILLSLVSPAALRADTIVVPCVADSTMFNESGSASNGMGMHLFTGRTQNGESRRGLVRFDLSALPPGSVVTGATMRLSMSRTRAGTTTVNVHRAQNAWGEGASMAFGGEGRGADAAPGDATWTHRLFPDTPWNTAGGDFSATSSGSASVGGVGSYNFTGAGMAADVQAWVNDPATNHGWILIGPEVGGITAKRFDSRQHETLSVRPSLTVTFTPPANTGSCCTPLGDCIIRSAANCALVGGTYRGNGTSCTPNPCPPPTGACCAPQGTCSMLTQSQCTAAGGSWRGANVPCGTVSCPVVLTPFVDALPIPPVAQPTSGQSGGAAHYDLAMREFTQQLHRDLPPTRVWGYAGSFPGPTIIARRGQPVTVTWINDLRDATGALRTAHPLTVDECLHGPDMTGQVPVTVVHLHGGHTGPESDGYPEARFPPGQSSPLYVYPNNQPAAGLWYHDHALGITRLNVYMGLAGAYLIRDPVEDALNIPRGQFEIPLIITDRTFNPDGSLKYPAMWHEHFFGDKILVNGKVWPFLRVAQGKYRFRIVNACGSRTLTLERSDGFSFVQIGSDLGLLAQRVSRPSITLGPAERADVIIDFGIYPVGAEFTLRNSAPAPFPGAPGEGTVAEVMKFMVIDAPGHTASVPLNLASVPRIPEAQAVVHRDLVLQPGMHTGDPNCMHAPWLINGMHWADPVMEFPRRGDTEVWSWINRSGVMHPMHIHMVLAQVLDRQPFDLINGQVVPSGPRVPPGPGETGWKDTVQAPPLMITRVIARYDGEPGLYPYHCHIIEHEDNDMMRPFRVVCAADFNLDGEINPDDLSDYITCFFSVPACDAVDFNRDGDTNPDDLSDYITTFFSTGC